MVASGLYLFNQGDILATAVPGFPVFDLAGFVGSSPWGVGVIALGAAVLRRPVRHPAEDPAATRPTTVAAEPAPGSRSIWQYLHHLIL